MATFPDLEPIARDYGMGEHIMEEAIGQNGDSFRMLFSDLAPDIPVRLEFRALSLAQVQQIRDHYAGQRGDVLPFDLPASCWRMHSSFYDIALPGMQWVYAGPVEETPRDGGLFDVSIPISSVF